MAFLASLLCLTLIFYKRLPAPHRLIFIYAGLLITQVLLVRDKENTPLDNSPGGFVDYSRNIIFPVICILLIFDSLGGLVHYINPKDIDPLLVSMDHFIFNGYPTVMLEAVQSPVLTDILQLSYSTYYFIPILLGVILKLNRKDREFDRALFLILFCFYLSYIGYILFPALGPRYTINHLQSAELKGFFITDAIQNTLNRLEGIKRDAFPSGHTGITLVVLMLAYRYNKAYFYIILPVITLLIFSTVYCRYHYAVDVIGGIVLAVLTFVIGERIYGSWEKKYGKYADTF